MKKKSYKFIVLVLLIAFAISSTNVFAYEQKYVDGVESVDLTTTQLIIKAINGCSFDGSDITLTDLTDNKKYTLGIWLDNPDVKGVLSNKIIYSNLHLKKGNTYEIKLEAGAIVSNGSKDIAWSKEYTARITVKDDTTTTTATISIPGKPTTTTQVAKGKITILSPSKSDYYIGKHLNTYAIGNSISVSSINDINGLAVVQFLLPELCGNGVYHDLVNSLEVSDLEIKLNQKPINDRTDVEMSLTPNQYYAHKMQTTYASDNYTCASLLVNVCGVKSGDKLSIKIPKGALNIPNTTIQNNDMQFEFNILTYTEKAAKYAQDASTQENIIDPSSNFYDVPTNHWAYNYIKNLNEKCAIQGYEDLTFKPDRLVSRSEFAKIMMLAFDIPIDKVATQSFEDVSKDNWAFDYVEAAKEYLTGFQENNKSYYKGNDYAVREDIAAAMVKAAKLENQTVNLNELKTTFKDYNSISQDKQKYVLIAYKNKLISGYPGGTFGPQKPITRAETAALLTKVMNSDAMATVTFE